MSTVYGKLMAYYPFEDRIAEQVSNRYPQGDVGALDFAEGVQGNALHFKRDSSYFTVPSEYARIAVDWSVAFWFNADSLPHAYNALLDKTKASGYSFQLKRDSNLRMGVKLKDSKSFELEEKIHPGTRYFVTATFDTNQVLSLYVNGKLVQYGFIPLPLTNAMPAIIGGGGTPFTRGYQFYGKMDELCFFNGTLSALEVELLHHNGIQLESVFLKAHLLGVRPEQLTAFEEQHPNAAQLLDSALVGLHAVSQQGEVSQEALWSIVNFKLSQQEFGPSPSLQQAIPNPIPTVPAAQPAPANDLASYWWIMLGAAITALSAGGWWLLRRKKATATEPAQDKALLDELQLKEEALSNFAVQIVEKSKFIDQIGKELKTIRETLSGLPSAQLQEIVHLETKVKQVSLREKDKKEFDSQAKTYTQVFAAMMKSKYPALTQKDLRLVELLRVGMSSKEIATILNISPKSVDTNRHRLRKKIGLRSDENLQEFLKQLAREQDFT
ncbi:MAG: LamG-like jellyroll fold domain-containing protein [Bacteroidota bacterium]